MPEHAPGSEPQVEAEAPTEAPAGPAAAPVSGFGALASRSRRRDRAQPGNAAVSRLLLRQPLDEFAATLEPSAP